MAAEPRSSDKRRLHEPSRPATSGLGRVVSDLVAWAHGRLPGHARRRVDTEDVVQQVLTEAIPRLDEIEPASPSFFRNYLKRAIRHRIIDEIRRSEMVEVDALQSMELHLRDPRPTQLEAVIETEDRRRFRRALAMLPNQERLLIVGRLELNLSYLKLAMATGRPSADAARVATRRALLRLARLLGTLDR